MPTASSPCLTERQADDYLNGRLPAADRSALDRHLAGCADCRRRVGEPSTATADGPFRVPDDRDFHAALDSGVPEGLAKSKRYRDFKKLGAGGMGVVYQAEQVNLKRTVVLKVIRPEKMKDEDEVRKFRQEAQAAARLHHPNIVATYDADEEGGAHFIVMAHVEGTDLAKLVEKLGPLKVHQACGLIKQAADGLQHAHEQGLVHRDIKPHNIMVSRKGHVTILDFGLARLAREGGLSQTSREFVGTAAYMAPEQVKDARKVDIRADIYALGCTLFYLLTGRPVFQKNDIMEMMMALLAEEPPALEEFRDDIPTGLASLVERMLAKDRDKRPATPGEVARALTPYAAKPTLPREFVSASGGKMVFIQGGRFLMGSPESEEGRRADEKQHWVTVSSLYLGETPVTQGQFRRVMGYNPSYFSRKAKGKKGVEYNYYPGGLANALGGVTNTEDFPVENVAWDEAEEYCERLNQLDTEKPSGWAYRLPREAEWEYACRAGAVEYHVFSFGDVLDGTEARANFDSQRPYGSDKKSRRLGRTCKVGSYKANAFGLYDMHGNVGEWCADWYDEDYYEKCDNAIDPQGPPTGSYRVLRGGTWEDCGEDCRSAYWIGFDPARRHTSIGFRLALVPQERQ